MQSEKTNVKAHIFQTAMALFRERGFENISIMEICKQAGVTRNAFYYYYSSKEDLLGSYFEARIGMQDELFSKIIALPSDWEKLWVLFEAHIKMIMAEGVSLTRQFFKINIDSGGGVFNQYFLTDTWCIPLLKNCQQSGSIQNVMEPEYLNFILTRLCLGIVATWCSKDGDFDLMASVREAFEKILKVNYSTVGQEE